MKETTYALAVRRGCVFEYALNLITGRNIKQV